MILLRQKVEDLRVSESERSFSKINQVIRQVANSRAYNKGGVSGKLESVQKAAERLKKAKPELSKKIDKLEARKSKKILKADKILEKKGKKIYWSPDYKATRYELSGNESEGYKRIASRKLRTTPNDDNARMLGDLHREQMRSMKRVQDLKKSFLKKIKSL